MILNKEGPELRAAAAMTATMKAAKAARAMCWCGASYSRCPAAAASTSPFLLGGAPQLDPRLTRLAFNAQSLKPKPYTLNPES